MKNILRQLRKNEEKRFFKALNGKKGDTIYLHCFNGDILVWKLIEIQKLTK
jgi:hypothetical protein